MNNAEIKNHFKNANLEINIEKKEGCAIKLLVSASIDYFTKAQKQAIKQVGKEISIPGFRKGKAPEALILKKHKNVVDQETPKNIANLIFHDVQELTKLPILKNNTSVSYDFIKEEQKDTNNNNKSIKMTFSFEIEPYIPNISIKGIQLKDIKRPEVGEKEIEEAIRQTRFFYAEWKEIERPIKLGDYIILDLESLHLDPPEKVFADTRFEVTEKSMAKWMRDLLIGAKNGDVVEGTSYPDEDVQEEEKKKFEPRKVRLTIKKVEEAKLPDLNDDFAKKVGAPSVKEMRKSITEMLNRQADEKVDREKRERINSYLIQNIVFDLPQSLINSEREYRLKQAAPNLKQLSEEKRKKHEELIAKQARDSIALFYITKKIVDDEKLPITNEEIKNEAKAVYMSLHPKATPEDIKKIPQEMYALSISRLMLQKTQDYILSQIEKA